MRVSNNGYSRDLRRFYLAHRMLSQEARTHTISLWTGLSPERVRRLALLQRREAHHRRLPRHRGPSPTNLAGVLTSPSLRREAAALVGLCRILKVIPPEPFANAAATLPSVGRGERLCAALELFRVVVPHARITLDQLVLLVVSIAEGTEWGIDCCPRCGALIVVDRLSIERAICEDCQRGHERRRSRESEESMAPENPGPTKTNEASLDGVQLDLFCDSKNSDRSD